MFRGLLFPGHSVVILKKAAETSMRYLLVKKLACCAWAPSDSVPHCRVCGVSSYARAKTHHRNSVSKSNISRTLLCDCGFYVNKLHVINICVRRLVLNNVHVRNYIPLMCAALFLQKKMNLMALSNVISVLLFHALVRQHHCHARHLESSSSSDISFEGPDLVASLPLTEGIQGTYYVLQAYKSIRNDGIYKKIRNNDTSLKSALRWYSIGHPTPLFHNSELDSNKTTLVQMGHHAFYIYFNMLTADQVDLLREAAEKKFRVDIDKIQITPLTLASFRCSFSLYDKQERQYMFKGNVKNFNTFPLQMVFPLSSGSKEYMVFKEQLPSLDHKNWPLMTCSMATKAKRVLTNTLTITSRQVDQIGMKEKLFGDSTGGQKEEVYVTRDQMAEFSRDMYASLNIIEEYDMPESQFSDAFVSGLIQQTASTTFKDVPIDQALASLSKYTVDVTTDLRPDEIKSELSNVLKVEQFGDKKRIVSKTKVAKERAKSTGEKGATSKGQTQGSSESTDQSASTSSDSSKSAQTSKSDSMGQSKLQESRDASDISKADSKSTSSASLSDKATLSQSANSNSGSSSSAEHHSDSQSQSSSSLHSKSESGSASAFGVSASGSKSSTDANKHASASSHSSGQSQSKSHASSAESLSANKDKQQRSNSDSSSHQSRDVQDHSNKQGSSVHKSSSTANANSASQNSANAQKSAAAKTVSSATNAANSFAKNNEARTADETASLDDQINELNRMSKNNVQWQLQGNKVIPKSINVARMTRGGFDKTLNFNRVKIQKIDADFSHTFSVTTARIRLKVSNNIQLTKLADRVDKLEALCKKISSNLGY